jgi:hypothetical protein
MLKKKLSHKLIILAYASLVHIDRINDSGSAYNHIKFLLMTKDL